MPIPRPEVSVIRRAVVKPGRQISCSSSDPLKGVILSGLQKAILPGPFEQPVCIEAPTIINDIESHPVPIASRGNGNGSVFLNAVIHGIAHHMHQRFGHGLQYSPVEPHFVTDQIQADRLPRASTQILDQSRQATR